MLDSNIVFFDEYNRIEFGDLYFSNVDCDMSLKTFSVNFTVDDRKNDIEYYFTYSSDSAETNWISKYNTRKFLLQSAEGRAIFNFAKLIVKEIKEIYDAMNVFKVYKD